MNKTFSIFRLTASGVICAFAANVSAGPIHDLVAKAKSGDVIRIAPGTYEIKRPVTVPEDKVLSIVAEDPANTVVDAGGVTNCFVFLSRGNNLLKGFTVRNGRGAPCIPGDETWYAGGVVMRGGTIDGCRIENCSTLSPFKAIGGGVTTWGFVNDTVISNCHARVKREHNGGTHPLVCSGGGMLLYDGRGAKGCKVLDCSAEALSPGPAVGGYGGGVEMFGGTVLESSTVSGCRASMGGGGVHVNSGGHVRDCIIASNSVEVAWRWDGQNLGGGICLGSASKNSRIERTSFTGNRIGGIDANEAPCGGGGLGVGEADGVTVTDCVFRDNIGFNGGAAYFMNSSAKTERCICEGNSAAKFGPNFAMSSGARVDVSGCKVSDGGEVMARPRLFNPDTKWMAGKAGVFQHRLYGSAPQALKSMLKIDPPAMAEQLADIGADYFCITIHQCEPSFLAPNDVYEDICGHPRGSICLQRDIPAELADALKKKGIRLMLYSTGTPPRGDREGVKRIGYEPRGFGDPGYTRKGVLNWAKVLEFWSRRYGDSVSGWWIDGCYSRLGFDKAENGTGAIFEAALKAGNPNAVVSFNPGIGFKPYSPYEDYICGEINEPFFESCVGRWVDGRQWHVLTYLHAPMGFLLTVRYTDGEWIDWLGPVLKRGGCVTLDARSLNTGCIAPVPAAQLKRVFAAVRGRLDPTGPDALKIKREDEIRRRTDLIDGYNTTFEHGQRRFTKCQSSWQDAVPDRSRLRYTPQGEEIWTDAIQATLDAKGGVHMPARNKPYLLDGPIRLKNGQVLTMGQPVILGQAIRKRTCTRFKAAPGAKGPFVIVEGSGADNRPARDIYIKGVMFEECENPMSVSNVDGFVAREIAFMSCKGTGMKMNDTSWFRADGIIARDCDGRTMSAVVEMSGRCEKGMIRNIDPQGIVSVKGTFPDVSLEAVP